MPNSRINPDKIFDVTKWVISIINTGTGTMGMIGGHSILLIEGIDIVAGVETLFVGQYDIRARVDPNQQSSINTKGIITDVICYEGNTYTRDYSRYLPAESYHANPAAACAMIASIKIDKETTERANQGLCNYLPYQYLGKNHPIVQQQHGDNCASWCQNKAVIAGAEIPDRLSKPSVVAGQKSKCMLL